MLLPVAPLAAAWLRLVGSRLDQKDIWRWDASGRACVLTSQALTGVEVVCADLAAFVGMSGLCYMVPSYLWAFAHIMSLCSVQHHRCCLRLRWVPGRRLHPSPVQMLPQQDTSWGRV